MLLARNYIASEVQGRVEVLEVMKVWESRIWMAGGIWTLTRQMLLNNIGK
jgi:hypothetical protein